MGSNSFKQPSLLIYRVFRVIWFLTSGLPTRRASGLRRRLLRMAGATVGEGVTVGPGVRILAPHRLELGNRVGVARDACLDARGGLQIGADAMVGFESALLSETHKFDDPERPVREQGMEGAPIVIGRGAWIGARAFVFPGRVIGDGAIIGAATIVTRDVAPNTIVAGNPARELRARAEDD